jgi:hypothetical protein
MSDLPRSPNVFNPKKPSAVGSRNSLAQDGRDQKAEYKQLIDEEVTSILDDIEVKLPKEVLAELDVMGGLKEKLYNYYNQNYQNMFNRYVVTAEDEMVKKIRNFVDKEENKALARYTPKELSELLEQIGGADKFNTGEVEKSIVNMYGHLHGHVQRGMNDLENETNSLLRQKTDVGGFVRGENAYSVLKCAFKDSAGKPKTVMDVKLSVNILDSELISPIFQYQSTVEYIIKDQIQRTIMNFIDREMEQFQEELIDQGREELSDTEIIFEKMKRVTNFTGDEKDDPKSKRYTFLAKSLMDKIEGLRAEIDHVDFDALNIRENLKQIVDMENIRNRGFNTAINNLTAILDTSKMGYQYIENLKNARELIVREYEDDDLSNLPDERYQIRLKYYDAAQLEMERDAYDKQMEAFKNEILHIKDVTDVVYEDTKSGFRINDFSDLSKKMKGRVRKQIKSKTGDPLYEDIEKTWDEIQMIKSEDTDVEKFNRTYLYEKGLLKKMIVRTRDQIAQVFGHQNPKSRVILDQRLDFLRSEFEKFDYIINPYHIQPGLIMDMDITSIKRKKFTLNRMANVLNEFLSGISKGFQDAAFASFKRRRSTVRSDIAMEFSGVGDDDAGMPEFDEEKTTTTREITTKETKETSKVRGKADVTPSKRSRGRSGSGDLKEL